MDNINIMYLVFALIAVLVIIGIIYVIIHKKNINKIKQYITTLETEKNSIVNAPVLTELSKVQNLVKNERLTDRYNNWNNQIIKLKDETIPKITDLILDIDELIENKDYKVVVKKITYIEIEISKSREKADFLLSEMEHITSSEARNRDYITKLKTEYRKILNDFNNNNDDYDEIKTSIDLQIENCDEKFSEFEKLLENNEYDYVENIVDSLDEMIKNLSVIVEETPMIILMSKGIIPKRIIELKEECAKLIDDGYNLDYLNIEYNIEEIHKKITDIFDRARNLNIVDSVVELKTFIEYFDELFNNLEKEKKYKNTYYEDCKIIYVKLRKLSKILKDLMININELKISYELSDEEVKNT